MLTITILLILIIFVGCALRCAATWKRKSLPISDPQRNSQSVARVRLNSNSWLARNLQFTDAAPPSYEETVSTARNYPSARRSQLSSNSDDEVVSDTDTQNTEVEIPLQPVALICNAAVEGQGADSLHSYSEAPESASDADGITQDHMPSIVVIDVDNQTAQEQN